MVKVSTSVVRTLCDVCAKENPINTTQYVAVGGVSPSEAVIRIETTLHTPNGQRRDVCIECMNKAIREYCDSITVGAW